MTQGSTEPLPKSQSGRTVMEVCVDAARQAGAMVGSRFLTEKEINLKGRSDIVTDVDLASEKLILGILTSEFPQFSILAEESKPVTNDSEYTWVVDPIDGTRNYAEGIPHFCLVIALAKGSEMVVGVTFDPLKDEMFTAEQGKGAFLNGERITVSQRQEVPESILGFDLGYVDEKAGLALDMVRSLWPNILGMRLMGSSALGLAYAACGRLDIYFHNQLSPWDIASGLVLVREAGGNVVDKQGEAANLFTPSIIASSPRLIDRFLRATDSLEWRK
ncbi:MAG: inositol monophosphatase family protein [Chloroflexi bacterium]|nr:inositol monophosphatase family protein [Chloroflexota bacterium]MDA1218472.1 inositol monophosphatase family protein [Chloroflexota bacterium]